jgi:hypothetical protein
MPSSKLFLAAQRYLEQNQFTKQHLRFLQSDLYLRAVPLLHSCLMYLMSFPFLFLNKYYLLICECRHPQTHMVPDLRRPPVERAITKEQYDSLQSQLSMLQDNILYISWTHMDTTPKAGQVRPYFF